MLSSRCWKSIGLFVCLCTGMTGCSSLNVSNLLPSKIPEATAKNPVSAILAIWEPSEGQGVDQLPSRGFAGQILFITRRNAEPVKINGDVRIYVFDDAGDDSKQGKPIHQFDFSAEAWNRHLQSNSLGPSYHCFIPYSRKDNSSQTHCALRVRLTTKDGRTTYSDMVSVVLPGPERKDADDQSPQDDSPFAGVQAHFERIQATERDAAATASQAEVGLQIGTFTNQSGPQPINLATANITQPAAYDPQQRAASQQQTPQQQAEQQRAEQQRAAQQQRHIQRLEQELRQMRRQGQTRQQATQYAPRQQAPARQPHTSQVTHGLPTRQTAQALRTQTPQRQPVTPATHPILAHSAQQQQPTAHTAIGSSRSRRFNLALGQPPAAAGRQPQLHPHAQPAPVTPPPWNTQRGPAKPTRATIGTQTHPLAGLQGSTPAEQPSPTVSAPADDSMLFGGHPLNR